MVFFIQDWRRHGVLPPSSYPKHSIKVVSAKLLHCNGGARGLTVSAVGTPPHSPGESKFTESIPSLAHEPTINPDWRIMYAVGGGEWGFARLETRSVLFTPSTTETLCILILPSFFTNPVNNTTHKISICTGFTGSCVFKKTSIIRHNK